MRVYRPANLKQKTPPAFRGRASEAALMLVVSAVFFLLGATLYRRQASSLAQLDNGNFVVLGPDMAADSLKKVLAEGGYVEDGRDAALVADSLSWLSRRLPLPNLGAINKKEWKIRSENALALGFKTA